MRKGLSVVFTLLVALVAIGCGGTDINQVSGLQGQPPAVIIDPTPQPTDSPTPNPDEGAFVRLSNALTNQGGGGVVVDVFFNGVLVAEDLAFQEVTGYFETDSTSVTVEVRQANSTQALFTQNVLFQADIYQTAVLAGTVNPVIAQTTSPEAGVFVFTDDVEQTAGKAKFRFVNLAESLSDDLDVDQIKMVARRDDDSEFDLTGFVAFGASATGEFDVVDFDGVRQVRVVDGEDNVLGVFTGLRNIPEEGSERLNLYLAWNPMDGVNATVILTDFQPAEEVPMLSTAELTLIGVPDDPDAGGLSVLSDSFTD